LQTPDNSGSHPQKLPRKVTSYPRIASGFSPTDIGKRLREIQGRKGIREALFLQGEDDISLYPSVDYVPG
jgi:hypothetical protein